MYVSLNVANLSFFNLITWFFTIRKLISIKFRSYLSFVDNDQICFRLAHLDNFRKNCLGLLRIIAYFNNYSFFDKIDYFVRHSQKAYNESFCDSLIYLFKYFQSLGINPFNYNKLYFISIT